MYLSVSKALLGATSLCPRRTIWRPSCGRSMLGHGAWQAGSPCKISLSNGSRCALRSSTERCWDPVKLLQTVRYGTHKREEGAENGCFWTFLFSSQEYSRDAY